MKNLLILGGGTGGTILANRLAAKLSTQKWKITLVDQDERHLYQPGLLFIPFGIYKAQDVIKPKRQFITPMVDILFAQIETIFPDANKVQLADGHMLDYDILVIATGSQIRPEQIEGLMNAGWQKNVFDFYTLEGAVALSKFMENFQSGKLVLNVAEMPIKCPVAPLEFLFLADWYFTKRGIRDRVELIYATPLSGAFTKPIASAALGELLSHKGIHVEQDFNIRAVDGRTQTISSWDDRSIDYDLLVTIPTNMGAEVIENSKMGDELRFVPTDKHTLRSKAHPNVWVIGDAGNVPASKAGSVAHFMSETLVENIERQTKSLPPLETFDGHANCFIETGFDRGVMIDFNYDVEPLPGAYPLPAVGPFTLLKESVANHLGKLSFKWIYWNILLPGRPLPLGNKMSMLGKVN